MLLYRQFKNQIWRGVCCSSNAHTLRVSGWKQPHFGSSSDSFRQDRDYMYIGCTKQGDVHKNNVESADPYWIVWRIFRRMAHCRAPDDYLRKQIVFKFFAGHTKVTYLRYITVCNMMKKHQAVIPFLMKLGKGAPAAYTISNTNPDDLRFYIFTEEDIVLTIWAADEFVGIDHMPVFFYVNFFRYTSRLSLISFTFSAGAEGRKFQTLA